MEMTIKTGYKATDKNIQCRGFRFVPGQWHELGNNDPLELCKNGFHYCEQPSGVWAYYTEPDTRVWKVEVEECIVSNDPGADAKSVCRKIRLVEEVQIAGYRNTGDRNTGNWNTGNGNSTNNSSGFFCVQEPTVKCFDEDSGLLREEFVKQFPEYYDLSVALLSETEIGFATYSRLPGITPEKLKTLHAKHIEGRKKSK